MISAALALLLCAAITSEPETFAEVNDLPAPSTAPCDEEIRYQQLRAIEESRQVANVYQEWDTFDTYPQYQEYDVTAYYAPANDVLSADYGVSDGLNSWSGVNYHDGRTETYYSSNVLYHYRTSEWTLDSEGFWRTEEGYYVVAASDMEQGETFKGSKGTCIVLDTGCNEGVTDYYVAW